MNREAELADALDGLVTIVERVGCGDWRDENGQRLKDTKQWVAAYLAATKKAQPAVPDDVAKDAARYRWLRDRNNSLETRQYDKGIHNGPSCYHEVGGIRELKSGSKLDTAIDAAILSAAETEGRKDATT